VAELKTKLDRGTYVKPTARTLGEYATEWLPRRERSDKGLRASTLSGYRRYIEVDIEPSALGGMKLTDIRRYHVAEFVNDLNEAGRGAVTVRRILTLLGTIFGSAVKDELISANPAQGADKPALSNAPVEPWEPEKVRMFLSRCARHRLGALFEVAILTGLRRGEITGLKWSDVDLAKRKIDVRRNRVSVRGKVIEQLTTKTKAGLRTVALSEFAVATPPGLAAAARPGGRGSGRGLANRGPRLHHGRWPSARSGLCDAALSGAPHGVRCGAASA
jgi:integrase